jgi:CheY-like chemotaxis protein
MNASEGRDNAGNVLAVDDCPAMREIVRASLECRGYSVHSVDSGQAALDAATEVRFDVILLDVEMPGLDGMAVGRALRSAPQTAAAAIAMHSSITEAEVRTGFAGYDAYIPKGADLRSLGEQVDRLVRTRRAVNPAQLASVALPLPVSAD